ncbi:MAG: hypothetical protein LBH11_04485, partial [Propionibacteriaceae bacterium]|nr:hypothetical protein [Propionibacteriaceae bacterium]
DIVIASVPLDVLSTTPDPLGGITPSHVHPLIVALASPLTKIIADAVAEGLVARTTGPVEEVEPLADWEKELLAVAEPSAPVAATDEAPVESEPEPEPEPVAEPVAAQTTPVDETAAPETSEPEAAEAATPETAEAAPEAAEAAE